MSGWKFVNNIPDDLRSFVFIGAPHTSNYDFIPAMAISHLMKRNAKFVIKSEWLSFPLNLFLGPMGAIGVDRKKLKANKTANYTDLMSSLFKEHKELVLMIAPEATRSPNSNWKTGFYYVAQKAGVPIVLGYADYAKKEAGIGKVIYPKDFNEDMKEIMNFYRLMQGKNPAHFRLDEKY
jgi:1-acyl-sn-glycerol-3-phosphate acyltransferase